MTNQALFDLGRKDGVGSCIIIDNNGWYGVLSNGRQVSQTTNYRASAGADLRIAIIEGDCKLEWALIIDVTGDLMNKEKVIIELKSSL